MKWEQKHKISVTIAAVADMIRKMAEWPADAHCNITSVYFTEDEAILYDIRTAVKPLSPKGGLNAKKMKET